MVKEKKVQPDLPGVERKIDELQKLGIEYAGYRDERTALLKKEVELKGELLDCMKKHKLDKYEYEELSMEIVHDKERVRVKVKREESDGDQD